MLLRASPINLEARNSVPYNGPCATRMFGALGNGFVDPGDKPKALSHPGPPGRRASALDGLQVAAGGAAYDVLPARGDDPLAADEERAVDPIEVERLQAAQDVPDRRGVER